KYRDLGPAYCSQQRKWPQVGAGQPVRRKRVTRKSQAFAVALFAASPRSVFPPPSSNLSRGSDRTAAVVCAGRPIVPHTASADAHKAHRSQSRQDHATRPPPQAKFGGKRRDAADTERTAWKPA